MLAIYLAGIAIAGAPTACAQDNSVGPGKTLPAKPVYSPEDYVRTPLVFQRERAITSEALSRYPGANQKEVIEFVRSSFPEEMRRFQELVLQGSDLAADFLSELIRQSLELLEIRRDNPKRFEKTLRQRQLERKAGSLSRRIRESETADEKGQLKTELNTVLTEAFEIRQELMKADVDDMERELSELRVLIEQRQQNRDAIIRHRTDAMSGKADHQRW